MMGQVVSLTNALGVWYADGLELWVRQSLATALAIVAMVRLGITHPTAGATALIQQPER
jgi:CBS-domain-containing membrane protein